MDTIGEILIQLCKCHRVILAGRLREIGLFPGQDRLIYRLSQEDGQTMSQLVEKMAIQHATLFTMVERMEKAGLIYKKKDQSDQRSSRIYLSPQGQEMILQLTQAWKAIEQQITHNFAESDKAQILALLKRLQQNVKNTL